MLKMVGGVVVWTVSDRNRDNNYCRHYLSKFETLPHVLSFYPSVTYATTQSSLCWPKLWRKWDLFLQRSTRTSTQGSVQHIDINAVKNDSAHILDTIIGFETRAEQLLSTRCWKENLCEPTIPFYQYKYPGAVRDPVIGGAAPAFRQ